MAKKKAANEFNDIYMADEPEAEKVEDADTGSQPVEVKDKLVAGTLVSERVYSAYRIFIADGKAWLVDPELIPADVLAGQYEIDQTVLDRSPLAYDFREEIEAVLPTVARLSESLWLSGVVSREDLADKSRVGHALRRVLPDARDLTSKD